MSITKIGYIIQDMEVLSLENKLIENMKIIPKLLDAGNYDNSISFFKAINERVWALNKSKNYHYTLYISFNTVSYYAEICKIYPEILNSDNFKIIFKIYINNLFKITDDKQSNTIENMNLKNEINKIISDNFAEFYYDNDKEKNEQLLLQFF